MSLSKFRFNKRRKHYSYSFKKKKIRRKTLTENILLTSKPTRKRHERVEKNVKLYKHPNPNCSKEVYLIPIVYRDEEFSFDTKELKWKFHPNDKRKVKRIKKNRKI
ncbi:MAG: hypothetical protein IK028_04395 [Bacilli bacterium]|nr:hypothetical protein [Bacilli bacterium]